MIRKLGWKNLKRWAVCTPVVLAVALLFGPSLRVVWSETTGSMRMVPVGTTVTVRLLQRVDSKGARPGDLFEARVVAVEPSTSTFAIAPGTLVEGRCLAAREAGGEGRSGYLRLALSGMRDSWGHIFPLETTTLSQWGSESAPHAQSASNDDLASAGQQPESIEPHLREGDASEATLTSEVNLTFVLLKPALVPRSHEIL